MRLRPDARRAWQSEMAAGRAASTAGDLDVAFRHFERAHVIGQRNTWAHTRAHLAMFAIGWRRRDPRELLGQAMRIPAALTKTLLWVPRGNTGGADVGALRSLPVPADLACYLD
ncbi:MAG: DUF3703 domain-containing protein [Xanthomonadales bacterium]|nr:DUF3703 domain-containing protein [Xanthomonadales bacterium]